MEKEYNYKLCKKIFLQSAWKRRFEHNTYTKIESKVIIEKRLISMVNEIVFDKTLGKVEIHC